MKVFWLMSKMLPHEWILSLMDRLQEREFNMKRVQKGSYGYREFRRKVQILELIFRRSYDCRPACGKKPYR